MPSRGSVYDAPAPPPRSVQQPCRPGGTAGNATSAATAPLLCDHRGRASPPRPTALSTTGAPWPRHRRPLCRRRRHPHPRRPHGRHRHHDLGCVARPLAPRPPPSPLPPPPPLTPTRCCLVRPLLLLRARADSLACVVRILYRHAASGVQRHARCYLGCWLIVPPPHPRVRCAIP